MNSIQVIAILALLVVSAHSAPTETESPSSTSTGTSPTEASPTNASSSTSPDSSSPAGMPSSTPSGSQATSNVSSSFTCFNRAIGYYGDVERDCKVYHFCLLGDYNGESVYQRITYLCLNDTVFDQQVLDCVSQSKLTAPCNESPKFYDDSNKFLRDAIVGNQMHQGQVAVATTQSS